MNVRSIAAVLILTTLAAATAPAGTLALNQVGEEANWLVHIDADAFKASTIGTLIRGELANMGVEEKLAAFAQVFGFHPLNDLRDITLYGTGPDKDKAVALLDAAFKPDQVLALLAMNPEYEKTEYDGYAIHRWVDEGKKDAVNPLGGLTYGAFFNDGLAVLSSSLDGVKKALDVLNNKAPAAGARFAQSELKLEGAFIQIAANRIDQLAGDEPQTMMLKQAKELGVAVGENEGKFFVDCGLTAVSEEAAININKMIDGLLALVILQGQEQPQLADFARQVQTSRIKDTLHLRFETPAESLVKLLKELWQKQQQQVYQVQ